MNEETRAKTIEALRRTKYNLVGTIKELKNRKRLVDKMIQKILKENESG